MKIIKINEQIAGGVYITSMSYALENKASKTSIEHDLVNEVKAGVDNPALDDITSDLKIDLWVYIKNEKY